MARGIRRPNGAGRVDRQSQKIRYPLFSSSVTKARIDVANHRIAQLTRYDRGAQERLEEHFNTTKKEEE
jgi:hypothetical protein